MACIRQLIHPLSLGIVPHLSGDLAGLSAAGWVRRHTDEVNEKEAYPHEGMWPLAQLLFQQRCREDEASTGGVEGGLSSISSFVCQEDNDCYSHRSPLPLPQRTGKPIAV
jgi:hypothetical protein